MPPTLIAGVSRVFVAEDEESVNERLYVSDGTSEGTHGVPSLSGDVRFDVVLDPATTLGDTLYFMRWKDAYLDLWRTDGTDAGTEPVTTGLLPHDANIFAMAAVGGRVLFCTARQGNPGLLEPRLRKSDGTAMGTMEVHAVVDGVVQQITSTAGATFLTTFASGNSTALWRLDGENASKLSDIPSSSYEMRGVGRRDRESH